MDAAQEGVENEVGRVEAARMHHYNETDLH